MESFRDQYYCQSLELKREESQFKSELCLASISLQELKQNAKYFLHPQELKYLATLVYEKRQLDYLLGNFTAKQAVAHYEHVNDLTNIIIEHGLFHYPLVNYPGKDKIQVSDSHSNRVCIAIAFSEMHPMAIDIEAIDVSKIPVIETQLTAKEKELIKTLAKSSDEKQLYTLFWTIKESLSKALRTGLTTPFEIFAVKNIKLENDHWVSEFENFTQYKTISMKLGDFICSIICPRRTDLIIDIPSIQQWLVSHHKP